MMRTFASMSKLGAPPDALRACESADGLAVNEAFLVRWDSATGRQQLFCAQPL